MQCNKWKSQALPHTERNQCCNATTGIFFFGKISNFDINFAWDEQRRTHFVLSWLDNNAEPLRFGNVAAGLAGRGLQSVGIAPISGRKTAILCF
jgi:hypothetical protein